MFLSRFWIAQASACGMASGCGRPSVGLILPLAIHSMMSAGS